MNPRSSIQDVLRCNLCETLIPTIYCDICQIHLCTSCVGVHLSNESKEHKVEQFEKRRSNPLCPKHSTKIFELYCEHCYSPICVLCVSSGEHEQHKNDIFKKIYNKKEDLQGDLHALQGIILPKYEAIASDILNKKKTYVEENSHKLKSKIDKQGEEWHNEIDTIIRKFKSNIDEMDLINIAVLNKHRNENARIISEIKQSIAAHERLINSSDFYLVSEYRSSISELRTLQSSLEASVPSFTLNKIDRNKIYQQFGSLLALPMTTEYEGNLIASLGDMSLSDRTLFYEPRVITVIQTGYGESKRLHNVSFLNDEEIWTCGHDNFIRRYSQEGDIAGEIETIKGTCHRTLQ